MFGIHIISVYLLAVGLLTLLAAVLIWQRQRSGKTVIVWLSAGVVGILLGSVGSVAIVCLAGYEVRVSPRLPDMPVSDADFEPSGDDTEGMGGGMPGMGGPPGMGGMGGGPPQPRPKRDLTNLVRKLELLTGDVGISLSGEQAAGVCNVLADAEKVETMSDDDAQDKLDKLLALLDKEQKARLEAVSLPRRRGRGPGGGPGGPGGGPGGPGGPGGGPGGPGGGPGGPGGGPGGPGGPGGGERAEDANPFQDEANAQALNRLRERFGAKEAPAEKPPAEQ